MCIRICAGAWERECVTSVNNSSYKKLSAFLDHVWENFARLSNEPRLLNKGQYYQLIQYLPIDMVDAEVSEKLDLFESIQ